MSQSEFLKAMGVEVYRLRPQREAQENPPLVPESDQWEQPEIHLTENSEEVVLPPSQTVEKPVTIADSLADLELAAVEEIALKCERCSLSRSRNHVVFGSGSEDADLMFIGEAPGEEEDRQGLPFVGRAGNLLTSMITALGCERDNVYICNVVKCRPPNNRDPLPSEAKACNHFLRRQIELIRPKVIVALGRVSAQLLLDTEIPLGMLRRKAYKFQDTDIDLVVTYHPAYLLRKPTEKAKSWDDLWDVRVLLND